MCSPFGKHVCSAERAHVSGRACHLAAERAGAAERACLRFGRSGCADHLAGMCAVLTGGRERARLPFRKHVRSAERVHAGVLTMLSSTLPRHTPPSGHTPPAHCPRRAGTLLHGCAAERAQVSRCAHHFAGMSAVLSGFA